MLAVVALLLLFQCGSAVACIFTAILVLLAAGELIVVHVTTKQGIRSVGERSRNSKFSTHHQDQSMEILATRERAAAPFPWRSPLPPPTLPPPP